ncbi:MAG: hypothetical protein ACJAT6_000336 [Akkermansiaceae bacterium]
MISKLNFPIRSSLLPGDLLGTVKDTRHPSDLIGSYEEELKEDEPPE